MACKLINIDGGTLSSDHPWTYEEPYKMVCGVCGEKLNVSQMAKHERMHESAGKTPGVQ